MQFHVARSKFYKCTCIHLLFGQSFIMFGWKYRFPMQMPLIYCFVNVNKIVALILSNYEHPDQASTAPIKRQMD